MKTLMEILNQPDERERKSDLRDYELAKSSCNLDNLAVKCHSCKRLGTKYCFNPQKSKNYWKWG